ncbi:hypothetical protein, partial [Thiosulfatihalobacter marinus]|uniref:hypothetical protein n=1 Tax=Thiosulfatihalobacter marinus TaxID=2792481 RepID=UPI001E5EC169
MKYLSALGVLAGGFLLAPPPRAVLTTMLWVVSRSHRKHPAWAARGQRARSQSISMSSRRFS